MLILRAIFQKHRIIFLSPWGTGRSKPDVQKMYYVMPAQEDQNVLRIRWQPYTRATPSIIFFHSNSSCLHSVCCLGVLLKGWEALFVFSENGTLP